MPKKILLLDPDPDYARTIAQRCQALGLEVQIASNATDATVQLTLQEPDVVCVDVVASQLDGLAFCEYLAWNTETRDLPVIVLHAAGEAHSIQRCCTLQARFVEKSLYCWDRVLAILCEVVDVATPTSAASDERV